MMGSNAVRTLTTWHATRARKNSLIAVTNATTKNASSVIYSSAISTQKPVSRSGSSLRETTSREWETSLHLGLSPLGSLGIIKLRAGSSANISRLRSCQRRISSMMFWTRRWKQGNSSMRLRRSGIHQRRTTRESRSEKYRLSARIAS